MTIISNFHYPDGSAMPLSNFYYKPTEFDGQVWKTNEHYFQAMKSATPEGMWAVRDAVTAQGAKQAGHSAPLRADWDAVKIGVMRRGLEHKFVAGEVLGDWLLATGDALLVEGNHWGDTFWGVCDGEGENWLGHLLMARRAELRGGR